MSLIYGSADLVVAWLGENRIHDDMIGTILKMGRNIDKHLSTDDFTSSHLDPLSSDELYRFKDAFDDLLSRHWFHRVWVVQEIVLASKIPVYLAGSHWCKINRLLSVWQRVYRSEKCRELMRVIHSRIPLETCVAIKKSIEKVRTKRKELMIAEISKKVMTTCESDLSVTTKDSHLINSSPIPMITTSRDGRPTLFESSEVEIIALSLIIAMKTIMTNLEATIPHDHIYGLLLITQVAKIPKELKPDYTIPFPAVFHAYAKAILQHVQDLSILPRQENRLIGVPSWVPDFRSRRTDLYAIQITDSMVQIADNGVRITDNGKVCIANGVHLGAVTLASLYKPGKDTCRTQKIHEYLQNFETFLQGVCKIQSLKRETTLKEYFDKWYHDSTPVRVENLRRFYDCAVSGLQLPNASSSERYDSATAREFVSGAAGRSMIVTSSGIVARLRREDETAKEGDILSNMKSTTNSFLLRPTGVEGEYIFIGNCRVFVGASKVGTTEEYFASSKLETFRLV